MRFRSAFDMTTSASMTSPSTSSTPVVLRTLLGPPFVRMRLTSAPVLMDTPEASADRARDWVIPPMPPRTMP